MIPDFFVNIQDEEADEEGKMAMPLRYNNDKRKKP